MSANIASSSSGGTFGGYNCQVCGTWVWPNTYHQCSGNAQLSTTVWPNQWLWNSVPCDRIIQFRGTVKHPSDLPKTPKIGDAYYVEDFDALFVGHQGGWLLKLSDAS